MCEGERVCEANFVDVFLVGVAGEILSKELCVAQALQCGVHETSVPCGENILKITGIYWLSLLEFTDLDY